MTVGAWRKGWVALALSRGSAVRRRTRSRAGRRPGRGRCRFPSSCRSRTTVRRHERTSTCCSRRCADRSPAVRFSRSAASNGATSLPISCPICRTRRPAPPRPRRSAWRFAAPRLTAFRTASRSGRFSRPCSRQAIWTWPSSSRRRSRRSLARSAGCRMRMSNRSSRPRPFSARCSRSPFQSSRTRRTSAPREASSRSPG